MKLFISFLFTILIYSNAVAQQSTAKNMENKPTAGIKLYAINCGTFDIKDMSMFSDTGEYDHKPARLSDPCFLISHPKGILVWDTGLSDDIVGKLIKMDGFSYTKSTKFADELAKIHLTLKDINFVALSHFHFDHVGNLNIFKNSTWIFEKNELKYVKENSPEFFINPAKLSNWNNVKKIIIESDFDVFKDGTVVILKTPGHTPGHESLKLILPKSGTVIISGDEYHQRASFEPSLHVPVLNTSRAETMASDNRLKTILKNTQGRIIIQHDEKDFKSLPKFPNYLD